MSIFWFPWFLLILRETEGFNFFKHILHAAFIINNDKKNIYFNKMHYIK